MNIIDGVAKPMTNGRRWWRGCLVILAMGLAPAARAQGVGLPLVPATSIDGVVSPAAAAVLARTVTLTLYQVPLAQALATLADAAHVTLTYSTTQLPTEKTISLTARAMPVRDAFDAVLDGTGLEAVVSPTGRMRIRPRNGVVAAEGLMQQGMATISGYVRDSATGASIPQVAVRVDGTNLGAKSRSDGAYQIVGVAAGEYRVTTRRVGYIARTRTITVVDGQSATLNFLLNPPATKLDEVVTTAVGVERRYQVGNVVSTINVDSIAPTVPAASVTDLISGRAPGVEVVENNGLVGSGEAIRIRGQSSMALSGDPIIIVDGIREDNSPGGVNYSIGNVFGTGSPNRLNDIDFSQIETIDILKGPAATTEYGTDGANGVIVITTKRGTSGAPQWHAAAEQSASAIPLDFPKYYTSWGHAANGAGASEECPLFTYTTSTAASLKGNCLVDSVTSFNPLNVPAYSMLGSGPSSKYDLDVSGGSDALRYYVAGSTSNALGVTHLPEVFDAQALALGFPASALKPNSQDQRSLRANTFIRLGTTADMQVNVAYMYTDQNGPTDFNTGGSAYGISYPDSTYNYGYGADSWDTPLALLGEDQNQVTARSTVGLTVNWRPRSWFTGQATVGLDHGSQESEQQFLPQSQYVVGSYNGLSDGMITLGNGTNDTYTVNLRGTATATIASTVRAATSFGAQYTDNQSGGVYSTVESLSASDFTFNAASSIYSATQLANYAISLGGYVSEVVSIADRLFVTASLRVDAASGFGGNYGEASYPGAQLSYLAVNTRWLTVRLRGALGASGQQPPYGAALQQLSQFNAQGAGGASVTGLELAVDGNLHLSPERSSEYEGGTDLGFFANRLSIDVTGYSKTTNNELYDLPLGWDLNDLSYEENLGEVRNTGMEASLTAVVVQTPAVHWTVTVNASVNANKLVSLASGVLSQSTDLGMTYLKPGFPLYGYWGSRVSYVDANHDGILEANEITDDTALAYLGSSLPRQETSLQTSVGLFHDQLILGALFDYRSDFRVWNDDNVYAFLSGTSSLLAQNLATAPLWEQAQLQSVTDSGLGYTPGTAYQNGSYVRFRELSLTYSLPRRWARAIRVARLGLTGAVRNLALWTRYNGGDPETSAPGGGQLLRPVGSSVQSVENNDLRIGGSQAIPLTRSWTIRLNLGL